MQIKTKNWGPQYQGVSNLMGLKSVALKDVNNKLDQEVAIPGGKGGHAYGRHGAQTGWEAQFIRAATKVTPDQPHDRRGLAPTIRNWNGLMAYSDTDGSSTFDLFQDHGNDPTVFNTSVGNVAGGFTTPEAQYLARARGEKIIQTLSGPAYYAAQYLFKGGPRKIRAPLNAVHVVVGAQQLGSVYGLGFSRRDPKTYPNHSRAFVVRCIQAYRNQETWGSIEPNISTATFKFNVLALKKKSVAFKQVDDLFEFFDLDVLWQSSCSLIYRRTHLPLTNTHGGWRLITMYPDDLAPGWRPSLWLSDPAKALLKSRDMSREVRDYHWTGAVGSKDNTVTQKFSVPAWG